MKITKKVIEEIVQKIVSFLEEHGVDNDVCIYYNNKRLHLKESWNPEKETFEKQNVLEDDISPLDYFEYVNREHIISMSFEGGLYHILNGYEEHDFVLQDAFMKIFDNYGLYYELGNAWNLSVYPCCDDTDIEYTDYGPEKPEAVRVYPTSTEEEVPKTLLDISRAWFKESEKLKNRGPSVLGAGFTLQYQGKSYFMVAASPHQGSLSWECHIDTIRLMLELAGCENIEYHWGNMG